MKERITVDANFHFGKPCIAGTRIPVQNILELIEEGISFDKIIQDYYPQLTIDDIKACVRYVVQLVASEKVLLQEASI
ncbi:DUF433 domain-containing protein [Desulfatiglans anilini]|uniref:DUF433 domain-containing protein n=1 Tax=Desulfatiglans anilini TaxID=90728 RepID=UPI0004076990|nr:DUF433 domain-containing protein [Desulfatiglans anilini]